MYFIDMYVHRPAILKCVNFFFDFLLVVALSYIWSLQKCNHYRRRFSEGPKNIVVRSTFFDHKILVVGNMSQNLTLLPMHIMSSKHVSHFGAETWRRCINDKQISCWKYNGYYQGFAYIDEIDLIFSRKK